MATENGCYYCEKNSENLNTPDNNYAWFLNVQKQPEYENLVQTATAFFPNQDIIIKQRLCVNGSFGEWENLVTEKELNLLYDQYNNIIDVPENTDLAEWFPQNIVYNKLIRVKPNRNIKNTCVPNNYYSFYSFDSTAVHGYDTNGDMFISNFSNKVLQGWSRLVKIYDFNNLRLTDENFSSTDFLNNILTLNNSVGSGYFNFEMLIDQVNQPNFCGSIIQRLKDDKVGDYTSNTTAFFIFCMSRAKWNSACPIKIELLLDVGGQRNRTIVGYANKDSGAMKFYGFHELAKVQKLITTDITPLNGYSFVDFRVTKIDDVVTITFIVNGGTRAEGETIFKLPAGFNPISKEICLSVVANSDNPMKRIVILKDGSVTAYALSDSTNWISCSGSYVVNKLI